MRKVLLPVPHLKQQSDGDCLAACTALMDGQPVIAFLRTGDLPYWKYQTDHAVVVVGFDDGAQSIYLNDPFFDEAAIAVQREYFELAWLERDYYYATISG